MENSDKAFKSPADRTKKQKNYDVMRLQKETMHSGAIGDVSGNSAVKKGN